VAATRSRPWHSLVTTTNSRPPVAPRSSQATSEPPGVTRPIPAASMLIMIVEGAVELNLSSRLCKHFSRCSLVAWWLEARSSTSGNPNIGRCPVPPPNRSRNTADDHLRVILSMFGSGSVLPRQFFKIRPTPVRFEPNFEDIACDGCSSVRSGSVARYLKSSTTSVAQTDRHMQIALGISDVFPRSGGWRHG
jgi:hypothetical protein